MLTLTDNATTIISNLLHQPGAPEGVGVRITDETPEPGLALVTATEPAPGDQILSEGGATVYLDQTAATLLDDKVLDAAVNDDGRVEFSVAPQ
jgi:Fe-S cluster assembly iron-binding protein IscA